MNVSYTMFNNYHAAAKEFSNGDYAVYGRLMYIINTYAIEGVLVEDLSPVEKLFITSIKASIDKSIRLSEAGRKGGSHTSNNNQAEEVPAECTEKTNTETSEACFSDDSNEACKPLKMACNEEEEEIEKNKNVEEDMKKNKESEKNKKGNTPDLSLSVLFGSDFDFTFTEKLVFDWIKANNLLLTVRNKATLFQIADFLDENKLNGDFLNYSLGLVKELYPKPSLGMVYSSFKWENTMTGYEAIKKKGLKNIKTKAPKKCTICGSGLVERINNLVECPNCRNKGSPIWWELNTVTNTWDCSV